MESLDSLIGKQLGVYIVEEKIGEGTFLSVFKGRHPNLPRPVAIKVLNDNREEGRLTREATILAKIGNHPNIVEVYDADFRSERKDQKQDDKPAYMVMEYCDDSLAKKLERDKKTEKKDEKIDWRTAMRYAHDLADALDYIHSKGVIHGDIKPSKGP